MNKYIYTYVEEEKMHFMISDCFESVTEVLKYHWDNTTNIPFQLFKNGKLIIDMDGLEELKEVRNQITYK